MDFRRQQYNTILNRLKEDRHCIQVIVGPRQIGKSTIVSQILEKIDIAYTLQTADNVTNTDNNWIETIWEDSRLKMDFSNSKEYLIVIDEIQKIANWSEAVKKQWDQDTREKRNIKVLILGSSRILSSSYNERSHGISRWKI